VITLRTSLRILSGAIKPLTFVIPTVQSRNPKLSPLGALESFYIGGAVHKVTMLDFYRKSPVNAKPQLK
jgi:hypothetical protein